MHHPSLLIPFLKRGFYASSTSSLVLRDIISLNRIITDDDGNHEDELCVLNLELEVISLSLALFSSKKNKFRDLYYHSSSTSDSLNSRALLSILSVTPGLPPEKKKVGLA
ncbi:hypothetical protein BDA99DRAFT_513746 [Phascolomyces articulosus]|uniref:Uncharacterized protein n=1 Tax=Phascolomyces articulosus TaxID=60185 RepID=A0AAD5JXZ2_9FUNG|nr:hypothetical protein BDA99DRAFT_513746 [Phascolomyces articulosus]